MSAKLLIAVIAASAFHAVAGQGQLANLKLTNTDIVQMQSAGLSNELILEKVRTSPCSFDTSPAALVDLKKAGVPEPVILAMMARTSGGPAGLPAVQGFQVVPVVSNEVLNYGSTLAHIQHVPYSDILAVIQRDLADAIGAKGARQAQIPDGACCRIKIELLQAQDSNFGSITIRANLVLRASVDGTEFSKVFHGEAHRKKLAGSWRSWQEALDMCLKEATADLVKAVADDPQLSKLLSATGSL